MINTKDMFEVQTYIDTLSAAYQRLGAEADRDYINDKLKEIVGSLEIKKEEV